jgi:hypothetical protein
MRLRPDEVRHRALARAAANPAIGILPMPLCHGELLCLATRFRRLVKDCELYASILADLHLVAFAHLMLRQATQLAVDLHQTLAPISLSANYYLRKNEDGKEYQGDIRGSALNEVSEIIFFSPCIPSRKARKSFNGNSI